MDNIKKDPKDNLIPITKENAVERGRAGGIKAAQTRAKRKKIKDCLTAILELPVDERNKQKLSELGIQEDDMSNQMLLSVAIFQKAARGDVRAAEYIRDITGQQPVTKLDKARTKLMEAQAKQILEAGKAANDLSKLDEMLARMDAIAEEPENDEAE